MMCDLGDFQGPNKHNNSILTIFFQSPQGYGKIYLTHLSRIHFPARVHFKVNDRWVIYTNICSILIEILYGNNEDPDQMTGLDLFACVPYKGR